MATASGGSKPSEASCFRLTALAVSRACDPVGGARWMRRCGTASVLVLVRPTGREDAVVPFPDVRLDTCVPGGEAVEGVVDGQG